MYRVSVNFYFEGVESDMQERAIVAFMEEMTVNDVLASTIEGAIGAYEDTDRWPEGVELDSVEVAE